MVYFGKILIALLAFGYVCKANPLKNLIEDNEIEREKRQMKGNNGQTINGEQAEAKYVSPITAAASGALQAVSSNLQAARQNPFFLPAGLANLPGLGYGLGAGFGGLGGLNGFNGGMNPTGSGNIPETFQYGLNPQMGGPFPNQPFPSQFGQLDNGMNYGNLQAQLIAQQSQLQPQIAPFPIMPGYFPAYQNFQG